MIRCAALVVVAMNLAVPVRAQDQPNNIHQATIPAADARFEVLQSELAARWTFRLDRFTGRVAQLVKDKNDGHTWEDMKQFDSSYETIEETNCLIGILVSRADDTGVRLNASWERHEHTAVEVPSVAALRAMI